MPYNASSGKLILPVSNRIRLPGLMSSAARNHSELIAITHSEVIESSVPSLCDLLIVISSERTIAITLGTMIFISSE